MPPHSSLRPEPFGHPARLRVLLADDHDLFAEALSVTLALDERVEVAGRARNGREAVQLARTLRPDVVLMDLDMPVLDGIGATRRVRRLSPAPRVVVVTSSSSAEDERQALEAGAAAYVRKGGCASELFEAIFAAPKSGDSGRGKLRSALRPMRQLPQPG
jgi:DNA-binding NarL/FixJ family response regulator